MINNQRLCFEMSNEDQNEIERGKAAGIMAVLNGYKKKVFNENDGRSIVYKNAYNKSYDTAAALSPEEKNRPRMNAQGKYQARADKSKRDFIETHEIKDDIQIYHIGYESVIPLSVDQPKSQDKYNVSRSECTVGYTKGLNPPQAPSADINSIEELGYYLDSLTSQTPPTPTLNSLPRKRKVRR